MYFGVDYERTCMYEDFDLRQDIPARGASDYVRINVSYNERDSN